MRLYRLGLVLVLFALVTVAYSSYANALTRSNDCVIVHDQIKAVSDLISRRIPQLHNFVTLAICSGETSDWVSLQSTSEGLLEIKGPTGVSLARGLNHYLQYYCNVSFSWFGDNLELPAVLPQLEQLVEVTSPYTYRYYFNMCTFGYSTVWWNWTRWEREIDFMALMGINAPLAVEGQEAVWRDLWLALGINRTVLESYFTGAGFLAWHRMGNIDGWGGPLSDAWMDSHAALQVQILTRMRSLGMTPVLPGFAGHVPGALRSLYPNARISELRWYPDTPPTYFLDPTDPLFANITAAFMTQLVTRFGTDHLYNADPFNEMLPPSSEPAYLANVSSALYGALSASDPDAVWVLQGWFLFHNPLFWLERPAKAFLTAPPRGRLVVLDLFADDAPVWRFTDSFFDTPFIWCMLHNFGGRAGQYAKLADTVVGPLAALELSTSVVGAGMAPEAIETNPIAYELMAEMMWRSKPLDVTSWTQGYVYRRYGSSTPPAVLDAWAIMQQTVYECLREQAGTSASVITARPNLNLVKVGCCAPISLYYNPAELVSAWGLLRTGSNVLAQSTAFQYDLVMTAGQVLSNTALQQYHTLIAGYQAGNISAVNHTGSAFIQTALDMDRLLGTSPFFLLGRWIADARAGASTDAEADVLEFQARNLLTLWGNVNSTDKDYSSRWMNGLVHAFYVPRWQRFVDGLVSALASGVPFDQDAFDSAVSQWEWEWCVQDRSVFPSSPVESLFAVEPELFAKYGRQ